MYTLLKLAVCTWLILLYDAINITHLLYDISIHSDGSAHTHFYYALCNFSFSFMVSVFNEFFFFWPFFFCFLFYVIVVYVNQTFHHHHHPSFASIAIYVCVCVFNVHHVNQSWRINIQMRLLFSVCALSVEQCRGAAIFTI